MRRIYHFLWWEILLPDKLTTGLPDISGKSLTMVIVNPVPGHLQLCLEALVEAGVLRHELPVARLQRDQLLPHGGQLR